MKSRAQLAKDPRTMQFVVEQACPVSYSDLTETEIAKLSFLPIVIWVQIPPEPRGPGYHCDQDFIWRVTDCSEWEKMVGRSKEDGRYPCVCEHMGHLVE